jgi:hypothetical protein
MRVRVASANRTGGIITVERADADGDVYLDNEQWGSYYNRVSAKRLIAALRWAMSPKVTPKREV